MQILGSYTSNSSWAGLKRNRRCLIFVSFASLSLVLTWKATKQEQHILVIRVQTSLVIQFSDFVKTLDEVHLPFREIWRGRKAQKDIAEFAGKNCPVSNKQWNLTRGIGKFPAGNPRALFSGRRSFLANQQINNINLSWHHFTYHKLYFFSDHMTWCHYREHEFPPDSW